MTIAANIDTGKILQESETLNIFRDYLDKQVVERKFRSRSKVNPKKLRALALKVAPQCLPHVVNGLIHNLVTVKDPVSYLKKCFDELALYEVVIPELVTTGHHGMIIIDDEIIAIKLDCKESWLDAESKWIPEDEIEIQHEAMNNYMRDMDIGECYGRVVLFPSCGFSGIPREIHMRCTPSVEGLQKYPGKNWYYK